MPQITTQLSAKDHFGTIGARSGIGRDNYKVTPGLYAIGTPSNSSPVIVTANYKLTFDEVRKNLNQLDSWLLVVDTRGINVWCAAGKGTFSTEEVAYQVVKSRLSELVTHRSVILPQLAATGVSALMLKKRCGFSGKFGPVRIQDLPAFLHNTMQADEKMRSVTFSLPERAILIPVEIRLIIKPLLISLMLIALLSGIGPSGYSFSSAFSRGMLFFTSTLIAIFSGAILVPLALPYIPFRQFWLKGCVVAVITALLYVFQLHASYSMTTLAALFFWIVASSSFMAMNFTGSTPFTSLTGVEYEMRRGLPVQLGLTFLALLLWVGSPFIS